MGEVELSCIPASTVCMCVGVEGSAQLLARLTRGGFTGQTASSPAEEIVLLLTGSHNHSPRRFASMFQQPFIQQPVCYSNTE